MAEDSKISGLPRVTQLPDSTLFPVVTEGDNYAATAQTIRNYITGSIDFNAISRQSFIDKFNAAAGSFGGYDPSNAPDALRPYRLNGLWLSYEEALRIDAFGIPTGDIARRFAAMGLGLRTTYPYRKSNVVVSADEAFYYNRHIEVFNGDQIKTHSLTNAFVYCTALRSVQQIDMCSYGIDSKAFEQCINLEHLDIVRLGGNMSVEWSPKLSLESFQSIVHNATNTRPITITVHPDVYAKLTGESNEDWQMLLLEATEKQITFATT